MRHTSLARAVFVAETALLTVILTVAVQVFVAQPYEVERESMLDTLHEGQMILVDKLTPRFTGYARGDIVVFHPPPIVGEDDTPFIKRVIGLSGDRIDLVDGRVQVNGVPLEESAYVYQGQPTEPMSGVVHWLVPQGMLFVMGDHRGNSNDSRSSRLGPVPVSAIIGRAIVRYWPLPELEVLTAPAYPELAQVGQAEGPPTQTSMSR